VKPSLAFLAISVSLFAPLFLTDPVFPLLTEVSSAQLHRKLSTGKSKAEEFSSLSLALRETFDQCASCCGLCLG